MPVLRVSVVLVSNAPGQRDHQGRPTDSMAEPPPEFLKIGLEIGHHLRRVGSILRRSIEQLAHPNGPGGLCDSGSECVA